MLDPDHLHDQRRVYEAIRTRDVDALIEALTDPVNRPWAARHLGKLGDPRAVGPLIRLLEAQDFQASSAAAQALGRLRALEAVDPLLACVEEGPEDVMRAWAIDALGRIGSEEAVPALLKLLAHDHEGLRRTAAAALAEIGDPRAVDALEETARRESWLAGRHYRRMARRTKKAATARAEIESGRRDLNSRPPPPKGGALPG